MTIQQLKEESRINKYRGKFYDCFNVPRLFDNGVAVISLELYDKRDACRKFFNNMVGGKYKTRILNYIEKNIYKGFVKYGIKTTNEGIMSAWWECEEKKGAKPVWKIDKKTIKQL